MMNAAGTNKRFRVWTAEGDDEREVDLTAVALLRHDDVRAVIRIGDELPNRVHIGIDRRNGTSRRIEIVVDGWRFDLDVEDARRAALREAGTRRSADRRRDGPLEVRAIIPGRVAGVSVVAGDRVVAGQTLLVVEAMKMQNELRAPRDGVIDRIAVGVGETIDLGQVLVVLA